MIVIIFEPSFWHFLAPFWSGIVGVLDDIKSGWWVNTGGGSLSLVDEEGDFLELEVHEAVALVGGVAPEVVAHHHVPVRLALLV